MGFLASMLKTNIGKFKKLMNRFVGAVVSHLVKEFIVPIRETHCIIVTLYNKGNKILNFSSALYATDAKLNHINTLHGS